MTINNEFYRTFFESHPEPAWIVDGETRKFIDVNRVGIETYGYSLEEFLSMTVMDVVEIDEARYSQLYDYLYQHGKVQFRTLHRRRFGAPMEMSVSATYVDMDDGRRYLMGVCLDTVELTEREQQFDAIFNNIEEGVTIEDLEYGRFVYCNDKAPELLGYTKEELLSIGVRDLIPASESMEYAAKRPLMDTGLQTTLREKPVMRKDGSVFYADIDASKVYTIGGRRYIATLFWDVTQSWQTKRDLMRSQESLQILFNQIPEAVWVVDMASMEFIDCNEANLFQYGYTKEEFLALTIADIDIHDSPAQVRERLDAIGQGGAASFETQHLTKKGEVLDILISGQVIKVDDTLTMIVTCRDVTASKQKVQSLTDTNQELELRIKEGINERLKQEKVIIQQSKLAAKGEMISNIAHQWRQPLNMAALSIQDLLMQSELGELTPESLKAAVDAAMANIRHLSGVIDQFSHFFDNSDTPENLSILKSLNQTVTLMEARLKDAGITVRVSGEDWQMAAKLNDIRQVILVILNNAVDAIEKKQAKIPGYAGEITVTLSQNGGAKQLEICDNGSGIDPEIMERIFDPYFTTKFQAQGVGVSLYMCKMIVERNLKGRLDVVCSTGGLTCFLVEVP